MAVKVNLKSVHCSGPPSSKPRRTSKPSHASVAGGILGVGQWRTRAHGGSVICTHIVRVHLTGMVSEMIAPVLEMTPLHGNLLSTPILCPHSYLPRLHHYNTGHAPLISVPQIFPLFQISRFDLISKYGNHLRIFLILVFQYHVMLDHDSRTM